MRTRIALLIAVILVLSVLVLPQNVSAQNSAYCRDTKFIDQITKDLSDLTDLTNSTNDTIKTSKDEAESRHAVSRALIVFIQVRQSYEDQENLSANCRQLRQEMASFITTLSDVLAIRLAQIDNADSPDQYTALMTQTLQRVDKATKSILATFQKISANPGVADTPTQLAQVAFTRVPSSPVPVVVATRIAPTQAPILPTNPPPPTAAGSGPLAKCKDGTYSYAANHQGACAGHKGVLEWYR